MCIYDISFWPIVNIIQENKTVLLKEYNDCKKIYNLVVKKPNDTTSFNEKLYYKEIDFLGVIVDTRLWSNEEKQYYNSETQKYFDLVKNNCPKVKEIHDTFPEIRQWFWNTLEPGGQIRPHYGQNGILYGKKPDHVRLQFCWDAGEKTTFFLEKSKIEYENDLCFAFDDGMSLHWVKNEGNKPRTVLIVDLWIEKYMSLMNIKHKKSINGNFSY
jgi:hypothetical protein